MKQPSKIIMKIYSKYEITCSVCCIAFPIQEVQNHESKCTLMKCNNELCGQELSQKLPPNQNSFQSNMMGGQDNNQAADKIIRFQTNGIEMIACSKKCKKVAKFAYLLKKNDENQTLKTFETILRKRM